jgi:hypothetical protein
MFTYGIHEEPGPNMVAIMEARELRTVRGPGVIGSPQCNVIMEATEEHHAATIVALRNALADAIAELDLRAREHWGTMETIAHVGRITAKLRDDELRRERLS